MIKEISDSVNKFGRREIVFKSTLDLDVTRSSQRSFKQCKLDLGVSK